MPATALAIAVGAITVAGVGWPLASWWQVSTLEKPQYEVLKVVSSKRRGMFDSAPSVEIRRYSPYLIAKVVIDNPNMKEAMGQGFRKVAGFIFGGNTKPGSRDSEKIAMTTPVQSEKSSGHGQSDSSESISMTSPVTTEMANGRYTVSFVMPSKYTMDSLPKPNDDDVKIEEVPAKVYAAISWRGGKRPTDDVVAEKRRALLAELDKAGIRADKSANAQLFQYYPPFAPQAIRLADVLLPVDESSVRMSDAPQSGSRNKSS